MSGDNENAVRQGEQGTIERKLLTLKALKKANDILLANLMENNGDSGCPKRKTWAQFFANPRQMRREERMSKIEEELFQTYLDGPPEKDVERMEAFLRSNWKSSKLKEILSDPSSRRQCSSFMERLIAEGSIPSGQYHYNIPEALGDVVRVDRSTGEILPTLKGKALLKYAEQHYLTAPSHPCVKRHQVTGRFRQLAERFRSHPCVERHQVTGRNPVSSRDDLTK